MKNGIRLIPTILGPLIFAMTLPGAAQTSFPTIENTSDVTITLQRAGGVGGTPTYRLIIDHGQVAYEGKAGVFIRGNRTSRISHNAMNEMIEEFRQARFFELKDSYRSAATDLPTCITGFQVGMAQKRVVDYGVEDDRVAPETLIHLENRIDEIAGVKRWTKGSLIRRLMHWR